MVSFLKMHGLGNDFVVVDCLGPHPNEPDLARAASAICDRRFGVGADGLIMALPSEVADFRMRVINSDGSEAEMCGNGIRCLAKYVYDHGLTRADKMTVETLAGRKTVQLQDKNDVVRQVRVDMGAPEFRRNAIPMAGADTAFVKEEDLKADGAQLIVTCLSMGNPHCVTFVADVGSFPVGIVGPAVERHEAFPNRTNAEFVQVISAEEIRMRVWERGAGETLACGTGACAAAVASALNGRTGRRVLAHLPGGSLTIEWAEDGRVYMTGPAEEIFEGELDISRFVEA